MGAIKTIKRLAADILKIGVNRVRIKNDLNETEKKLVDESITRLNVKDLIRDNVVTVIEKKGRKRKGKETKKKKTRGKKKGKKYAKVGKKERWMSRIRAQRKYLKQLITEGKLKKEDKRMVYLKMKGGIFKSKNTMYSYLKDNKLLKE